MYKFYMLFCVDVFALPWRYIIWLDHILYKQSLPIFKNRQKASKTSPGSDNNGTSQRYLDSYT
jgi:hypothetical protein